MRRSDRHARRRDDPARPASERFRAADRRRLRVGLAASLLLHLPILWLSWGPGRERAAVSPEPPRLVILAPLEGSPTARPPAVRLPPPPAAIARPGKPVPETALQVDPPEWTPHDVPPRLVNLEQVRRRLEDEAVALAGEDDLLVLLWLYVERSGDVTRLRLRRSSGRDAVDRAAINVAGAMRFRPALFKGRRVAVWIAQPIRFSLRVADGGP